MDQVTQNLRKPFAGLTRMLERAQLPAFDAAAMIDARRRDMDAVIEANRIVYAGARALAQKQGEILRATMAGARKAVSKSNLSGSPGEIAARQRAMMVKAFQIALANMRDLAEIVRKAQADAFGVVKRQVEADLRGLVGQVKRGGAKAAAPARASKPARKPRKKAKARAKSAAKPVAKPTAKARAKAGGRKKTKA
jgi:phasin family protein